MGLDVNGIRFLLYAKKLGVNFARSATIGRQGLHLGARGLRRSLSEFGFPSDQGTVRQILNQSESYAEAFLRVLGAETIDSFDKSDYEGATCIHDMNEDLPDCFHAKYSMVLDGGSLEHVFNFPVAIRNCMRIVEPGGHYLAITPANNFMGHGFYQFSPELFFDIFSKDSGFELVRVMAYEDRPRAPWFSVANPSSIGARVTMVNSRPTYLLVIARRMRADRVSAVVPQQSDYVRAWAGTQDGPEMDHRSLLRVVRRLIPQPVKPLLKRLRQDIFGYDSCFVRAPDHRGFDRRFFQPLDPVRETMNASRRRQELDR